MSAKLGKEECGAPGEELVAPNSDDLIAIARARIGAVEGKVKEQVEQYINGRLAAELAEAERLSIVLQDTDAEEGRDGWMRRGGLLGGKLTSNGLQELSLFSQAALGR